MKIIIIAFTATLFFLSSVTYAEIVVIGNIAGSNTLTEIQVKNFYLGKKTKLPNGGQVILVEQQPGSTNRIDFHKKVTKRSESQLQSTWSRLVFTGRAESPIQAEDDASVLSLVEGNPNTIGYIDSVSLTDNVKVLLKL